MYVKRIFDFVISLAGIVFLFIPCIVTAILIKFSSMGPVIYKQQRIGRHGRSFTCIKFRTMRTGADMQGSITTASDPRVTAIGRILRRYKIDELPQLLNVPAGKMSFVGPRPDVAGYADVLKGKDRKILDLRPGITGPASIFFRNEEQLLASCQNPEEYNDTVIWPVKVAINRIYLEEWTLWKDIGYILITLFPALDNVFHLMLRFQHYKEQLAAR